MTKTNIKPLGNRVVIQIQKQSQMSTTGFVIATEPKNDQNQGIVVAVGEGYGEEKELTSSIKVGQKVLISKYGGDDYDSNQEQYKIVSSKDIIAIIE